MAIIIKLLQYSKPFFQLKGGRISGGLLHIETDSLPLKWIRMVFIWISKMHKTTHKD